MMRKSGILCVLLAVVLPIAGCEIHIPVCDYRTGWAIGWDSNESAAIVHTADSGRTWEEQGDPSLWYGIPGNDITAADKCTAWAALGQDGAGTGAIIRTVDGGKTWTLQDLPEGVSDSVKSIKALSTEVVWAVTLGGVVMRTMDAGENWEVIPHEGVEIVQVNRMDAKGDDIWIADVGSREYGMVHSADFGQTWRKELLPDLEGGSGAGPMAVSIVNSQTVWTAVRPMATLYRTVNGGDAWNKDAPEIAAENDLDDICAPSGEKVWAVQNIGGFSGGQILKVEKGDAGFESTVADSTMDYQYEGITCIGEEVWAVGFKSPFASADLPTGIIRHTEDGVTWETQTIPVDDAGLWKVSFVGPHEGNRFCSFFRWLSDLLMDALSAIY